MRELTKIYKALSDESRLRVLNLILQRECCVCEVMQALEISQSKASRILTTLYDVGFLKFHKDGLWSLYSIDWDGMNISLKAILKATKEAFKENKQMGMDCKQLKKARRIGLGCANNSCKRHRRLPDHN
ncbi:MAG: metalloregulator ArsR/SmtB family transcription factor [Dehalococcoidales bacterium]|nr:metalloregulator ArsR/SmtB family transcription factor [Dehalococcoidales bacterium]